MKGNAILNSITNTMSSAFRLIQNTGQPLSFENNCIQNMFILPSRIEAFHDNELFLKFIESLIRDRNNYAFPDTSEEYDRYFADCIRLKEQMQKKICSEGDIRQCGTQEEDSGKCDSQRNLFPEETWLLCTGRLFENLKTPFYSVYAASMLCLEPCFTDQSLFMQTLQDFYSVIIKSTSSNQKLIGQIAENASSYKQYLCHNEILLADILRSHLACFAADKNIWLVKLFEEMYIDTVSSLEEINIEGFLSDFQQKELTFLSFIKHEQNIAKSGVPDQQSSLENISFPEYLAQRTVYFSERRTKAPDTVFSGRHHSGTVSILSSDSILNRYAYNMTMASYITNPAIGRESEISDLELILISPKKSPILLGEAGVGKTAVVEGLAWLLQQGNVPKLLQHKELYKLTTTSLLSGTKYVGEMEERIRQLMDELEKHPDIILFIDEIHTIVGAGSTESSNNDISNMLKPYIDRGDIKIIGSTTSDEYRKYLLSDKALARRFYPITIEEPDEDTTLRILLGTIPSIEYETKVRNAFSEEETRHILQILISLSAKKYQPADKRTRRPELPLTLLEMAFSYAALYSRDTVSIEDFICAVRHSNLLKQEVKAKWQNIFIKE